MKQLNQNEKKKVIRECDWIFGISIAMFLIMRIAVLILFNITATETGAEIEAVHTAYEANPIFKSLMQLQMVNYVLQFLIIPAVGFAIYFLFRRKVLLNNYPIDTVQYQIMFIFFLVLMNFINDVASLIGRLI